VRAAQLSIATGAATLGISKKRRRLFLERKKPSRRPCLATIMSISPLVLLTVAAPHSVALPFSSNLHPNVAELLAAHGSINVHKVPGGTDGLVGVITRGIEPMSETTGVHCQAYLVRDICLL
jgi:hypothetical protein